MIKAEDGIRQNDYERYEGKRRKRERRKGKWVSTERRVRNG